MGLLGTIYRADFNVEPIEKDEKRVKSLVWKKETMLSS